MGLGILSLFPWLFSHTSRNTPSLAMLLAWAFGAAAVYIAARLAVYWAVWTAVIRRYPLVRGVHPAARGELPRIAYIAVVLTPLALCGTVLLFLSRGDNGISPEIWLALAVVAAVSMRDLRIVLHVIFLAPDCWIKESAGGLEILRPADKT